MKKLIVKGAREHNLKNLSIELPREKLIVISGRSGSGKSSLAFDTIFAEGQRRYVESLSAYARQFLGRLDKPDVDYIEGLSPAISIEQKTTHNNPRSTVGTITEIHDYFRLLFARIGEAYCPNCDLPIKKQSIDQIIEAVVSFPLESRFVILAPLVKDRKGTHKKVLESAQKAGFPRVRINQEIFTWDDEIELEKNKRHTIELVIDRIKLTEENRNRIAESIETALSLGNGEVYVERLWNDEASNKHSEMYFFSENNACTNCDFSMPELEPKLFSFNSPTGACENCSGLGHTQEFSPELIAPDSSLSFNQGAFLLHLPTSTWNSTRFEALASAMDFSLDTPLKDLSSGILDVIWKGSSFDIEMDYTSSHRGITAHYKEPFPGILLDLERRYKEGYGDSVRKRLEQFMVTNHCPVCKGKRLNEKALAVRVKGSNIHTVSQMSIERSLTFFTSLELSTNEAIIASQILKEICDRLFFMQSVGLEYLTLSREAGTLSGGEAQRIRLATQIGSSLMGVLYVLDEPTIGLHQRDNDRLLKTLTHLRDLGNTLIVVEHDEQTIRMADYIVDMGPGAGINGGNVVAEGDLDTIMKNELSPTGNYLSGRVRMPTPPRRPILLDKTISFSGITENNLKNLDIKIPLEVMTVITGISGSGKSTLLDKVIASTLATQLNKARLRPVAFKSVEGLEQLDKIINIDQSPIGRTPRSNPATYVGVFTAIRELFASLPEAKQRGYQPGRFSFNVKGGRCESCEGAGTQKIEMHFLADVYVECEVCHGRRFSSETLEVRYKDHSIYDVLELSVREGLELFGTIPQIKRKLQLLFDVGLNYIKLGQSALTLSGGEAQRIKLSLELSKRSTGKTFYIIDEPTTGLHFLDIKQLMGVLQLLVDGGNTVVMIEHNLDVICQADYIIDLGPEGGERGGYLVAQGTPEEVVKVAESYTGQYLASELQRLL